MNREERRKRREDLFEEIDSAHSKVKENCQHFEEFVMFWFGFYFTLRERNEVDINTVKNSGENPRIACDESKVNRR
jgi:hypothetical protein